MTLRKLQLLCFSTLLGLTLAGQASAQVITAHGIAMNGDPKYNAGFAHFEYVNPNAPKGGKVRMASTGSFDSFNGFIPKGEAADGVGMIYDTLMSGSDDEAFTEYGLIAEKIEYPEDRSWVAFHLNPKARFHDGKPITPADVIFTFNTLITKGSPFYKSYYGDVTKVEDTGNNRVKFHFKEGTTNRELPLIMGQLPVFPEHWWQGRDFSKSSLEPPLGSGAYRIKDFEAGKYILYERVENYWGADLPVNRGQNNFDLVRYDYYRDQTVSLEAFKAGEYDFRNENNSKFWATMYKGKNFDSGGIVKSEIGHELPRGMQGFAFNTRRSFFKDSKVREAIGYAFDFEWSNKNLFYGQYRRTNSYFENSELASSGMPTAAELKILEPFRNDLPEEVFTSEFKVPVTNGSGLIRSNLRAASRLLKEAGWEVKDNQRVHTKTGEELKFEVLLYSKAFERIVLPFTKNLEKLGIAATIRVVDTSQFIERYRKYDLDMIVMSVGQSLSPGNEQDNYWSCKAADTPGTRNVMGICNPAIDQLIRLVIEAPDRQALIDRTRALDRALLWGHYMVPHWHINYFRLAHWDKFSRPNTPPKYGLGFFTWWIDEAKEDKLREIAPNLKSL